MNSSKQAEYIYSRADTVREVWKNFALINSDFHALLSDWSCTRDLYFSDGFSYQLMRALELTFVIPGMIRSFVFHEGSGDRYKVRAKN